MGFTDVDWLAINTIRILSIDTVTKANSGHPSAPMGMAPVAHVLWNRFMNYNPQNANWINRDRFVLSNGHACALLLFFILPDMLLPSMTSKAFRSIDSITPGHPEAHDTEVIEVTTGPLGQGFANAVGLAISQVHEAAEFNKPGFNPINNYTYVFMGDGCHMEGVASEAASLAGHLQLGNLIAIYDDNNITIDGSTNCAFTEDVNKRMEAYGWHTETVSDGYNDLDSIDTAIKKCQAVKDKPSMIKLRTTIRFGSKLEELVKFGFNPEESFVVPQAAQDLYNKKGAKGAALEWEWNQLFEKYSKEYCAEAADFKRRISGKLPKGWEKSLPVYTLNGKPYSSRKLSEIVLQNIHSVIPELKDAIDFQPPSTRLGDWSGRYIRYGVRENAMGAIMNGLAAYGTTILYRGTFLNFVSYAAGAVCVSALSQHCVIWVTTHDSIGLSEDGPTHQPIETLAHFRALPNCMHTPSIIALSRQDLPQLENSTIPSAIKGGYIVYDEEKANIILVSTGSEVGICVDAIKTLKEQHNLAARVVSIPCFEDFDSQSKEYRLSVLLDGIPSMSVEVMSTMGWERYTHQQFGLDRFGASGPYKDVYKKFEFTPEGIAKRAVATVDFYKDVHVQNLRSPINRAFQHSI
ncbi:hypothetical protein V502_11025 [Pseudogymnoascus sp. VKM F-4520 (FW-2644)]|nr:hypothetical protein V502_11025 [Pseudogymnoascus sp. VKM F-4520 (FW-2644)]